MGIFRRTPPPREREPAPDSRVEAELQRVLALQRAVERTEGRLADIRVQQDKVDYDRRNNASYPGMIKALTQQAEDLREERTALESSLQPWHEEIATRLAALGNDALYLYPPPPPAPERNQ
jgi:predicted  nucleic acid-binding Zn-ribbon protein